MIIAVNFDNDVVHWTPYDATTPLQLRAGAREALQALKRADHQLLLWSARASKALLYNPMLDPLVRAGAKRLNMRQWELKRELHHARYQQMLDFVAKELPEVFDAIDDGSAGKPLVDMIIDYRAMRDGGPSAADWTEIARLYGAP